MSGAPGPCAIELGRRALVVSTGVPGSGEGSTVAYTLYAAMQRAGLEARLAFLVEEQDLDYLGYLYDGRFGNPQELPGVDSVVCAREDGEPDRDVGATVEAADPDVVLAIGAAAAGRLLPYTATIPLVMWATGQVDAPPRSLARPWSRRPSVAGQVADVLRSPSARVTWPRKVVDGCRLVLAPSPEAIEILRRLYPRAQGKIHPQPLQPDWLTTESLADSSLTRPYEQRTLDVVFVSARWDRRSKNLRSVAALRRRLPDLKMGLVGEVSDRPRGVENLGLIVDRGRYLATLGNSRVLVCPTSAFSAHCGPLLEASMMGCRIVCTPHCGNRRLVPAARIAESAAARHLEAAIHAALESEADADQKPTVDGFDDLLQILAVV